MRKILISILLIAAFALSACAPTVIETEAPEVTTDKQTEGDATEAESAAATEEKETTEGPSDTEEGYTALNYGNMKALWISQFDMSGVYKLGGSQRDKDDFVSLLTVILDRSKELGFNTVIYQVRPYADSMYPSEYFPPCDMVTGSHGKEHSYDVLEILVDMAHERDMSVQAWINPMRAMDDTQIRRVDAKYQIKQWYNDQNTRGDYIVNVGGRWYLNIGRAEVRELIVNGAREILENYEVDGLHMDDYFYPTTDQSFDARSYADYRAEGGTLGLAQYRKEVLSLLVKDLYDVTHSVGKGRLYGISPAGNYNTVVNSHYADVDLWCSAAGYIDYICPQVYFGMEHQTWPFEGTCEIWQRIIKTDSVKLIIGMSLGKAKSGVDNYAGSGKNEWSEHKDVLYRCLKATKRLERCAGVAYFCYQYFYDPITGQRDSSTAAEVNRFIPVLKDIDWNQSFTE